MKKVNPNWLKEKGDQLKSAADAYTVLHDIVIRFQDTRKKLEAHLSEIETRAGSAKESGASLLEGKEQIEKEMSAVKKIVEKTIVLEERLKSNSDRIREVQAELTENLRKGRFIFLIKGDTLKRDAFVLGGFALFFFLSILFLQGRRDRKE